MRRQGVATADRNSLSPDARLRIETAVLDVFAEREFHRVSLNEIARAANVSLQTLYKYYGSKEALLFACLDAWLSKLAVRMLDHLQGIEDYKERLRKVFWVYLDYCEKNPKLVQVQMSSVYLNTWRKQEHFHNPELFGTFIKVLREGRERGVLNDQVDEKYLLDLFMGFLTRLAQMYIHRGMKEPLTDKAGPLFDMLWRAISKPEKEPTPPSR